MRHFKIDSFQKITFKKKKTWTFLWRRSNNSTAGFITNAIHNPSGPSFLIKHSNVKLTQPIANHWPPLLTIFTAGSKMPEQSTKLKPGSHFGPLLHPEKKETECKKQGVRGEISLNNKHSITYPIPNTHCCLGIVLSVLSSSEDFKPFPRSK